MIAKPDYHSGDGRVYMTDPSMIAVTNSCPGLEQNGIWAERYRIVTDLNNDGTDDLILSDAYGFGNGGGPWTAYVHTNGSWTAIGDPAFHYGMFALEKTVDGEVRLPITFSG